MHYHNYHQSLLARDIWSSDVGFNGSACPHQTKLFEVSGTQRTQSNSTEQKGGTREFGSVFFGTEE